MTPDFVFVDNSNLSTAPYSSDLKNILTTLRQLNSQITTVKNRMDHMGDGTTWTTIEAKHGLPSGGGVIAYNALNGTLTLLNSNADLQTLLNRVV